METWVAILVLMKQVIIESAFINNVGKYMC